jgi:hypothetical protein
LLDIVVDHLMNLFWLEIEIEVVDTFYSLRMNKSIYIYIWMKVKKERKNNDLEEREREKEILFSATAG